MQVHHLRRRLFAALDQVAQLLGRRWVSMQVRPLNNWLLLNGLGCEIRVQRRSLLLPPVNRLLLLKRADIDALGPSRIYRVDVRMGYFRDRRLHIFISATGLRGPRHKLHLSVEHGMRVRYRFLDSLGAERTAAFSRVRDVAASLHRDGNVVVGLVSR